MNTSGFAINKRFDTAHEIAEKLGLTLSKDSTSLSYENALAGNYAGNAMVWYSLENATICFLAGERIIDLSLKQLSADCSVVAFSASTVSMMFYANHHKDGVGVFKRMDYDGNSMMNDGDCGVPEGQLEDHNCFELVERLAGVKPDDSDLFAVEGLMFSIEN